MQPTKPWIRFLVSCCIVFPFLVAKEVRAQSDSPAAPGVSITAAAASCSARFGELSKATAECVQREAASADLEACYTNTSVSDSTDSCFGLHPVQVGWLRMLRDMKLLHQDPSAKLARARLGHANAELVAASEPAPAVGIIASR